MKRRRLKITIPLLLLLSFGFSYPSDVSFEKLLEEIFSVPAPSGYEHFMVKKIQEHLPQGLFMEKDNLGSLYLTMGKGTKSLSLLAPMDEVGYIVSGINEEGYLRLDRVVPAPHRLYDSFHLGQPMLIWTEKGAVSGVVALPSTHILTREGREQLQNFSLDLAYLDIGATSPQEVKRKGVRMLDAVTPFPEFTRLAGEKIAGASLGNKMCTALLLHTAGKTDAAKLNKQTTFVWMAQTKFFARRSRPRAALGALRVKRNLNPKSVLIISAVPVERDSQEGPSLGKGPVLVYPGETQGSLPPLQGELLWLEHNKKIQLQEFPDFESSLMSPFLSEEGEVLILGIPVLFSSTPVEIVDFKDVLELEKILSILLDEGVVK